MSQKDEFHNLDNPADGLFRELASGVTTRIFSGEQAMLSVVTLAPHAQGTLHHHPEEQWGVLLDGSAIRVQGDEEIRGQEGRFLAHAGQRAAHHAGRTGRRPRARHLQPAAAGIQKARIGLRHSIKLRQVCEQNKKRSNNREERHGEDHQT